MHDTTLRRQLVELVEGGHAHLKPSRALADLPFPAWGKEATAAPYTLWQLLEHMRICQWDILEFSRCREHASPEYPAGYWPETPGPADEETVATSLEAFKRDLREMIELVEDPATDLFARIPWGDGQTILREAMLVADHNAYHIGQIVLLRKQLGVWREPTPVGDID